MIKLLIALALVAVIVVAGGLIWWRLDGRFRPKEITKHQAEITALLERSGWVSPHAGGPKVYIIAYRTCTDWLTYFNQEFPKLTKAGVQTRVILVARRDQDGQPRSTSAERSTVAELWVNRSLPLFDRWMAAEPQSWTAPGIVPADGDAARSAVVEQSRVLVDQLQPLLKDNGLAVDRLHYPTMIWWTKDGRMRACACEAEQTYRFVRNDLGAR